MCNINKEDGYEDKGRGQVTLVGKALQMMDSKATKDTVFTEERDQSTGNKNSMSVLYDVAMSALFDEALLGYVRMESSSKCCACKRA